MKPLALLSLPTKPEEAVGGEGFYEEKCEPGRRGGRELRKLSGEVLSISLSLAFGGAFVPAPSPPSSSSSSVSGRWWDRKDLGRRPSTGEENKSGLKFIVCLKDIFFLPPSSSSISSG